MADLHLTFLPLGVFPCLYIEAVQKWDYACGQKITVFTTYFDSMILLFFLLLCWLFYCGPNLTTENKDYNNITRRET